MSEIQIEPELSKVATRAMIAAAPSLNACHNGGGSTRDLDRLLPLKEVIDLTSLSKASIYRRFPDTFPAPVKCGVSRVAWRRSDIEKWLADRKPVSKLSATA